MAKSNYDRPYKWRPKGEPLQPRRAKYFAQLINSRHEPQTYSIPVCYRHLKALLNLSAGEKWPSLSWSWSSRGLPTKTALASTYSVASCVNGRVSDRDLSLWLGSYKADRRFGDLIFPMRKSVDDSH